MNDSMTSPPQPTPPLSGGRLFLTSSGKAVFMFDGAITFVVGILLQEFSKATVPLWLFAVMITILIGILLSLILAFVASQVQTERIWNALSEQRNCYAQQIKQLESQKPTRSVKSVIAHHEPYPPCKCILIVSWSSAAALAINTPVSIAMAEDTHEHPLGEGLVRRMQDDGCAVITLDTIYVTAQAHIEKLLTTPELSRKLRISIRTSLQSIYDTGGPPVTPSPHNGSLPVSLNSQVKL